jgi:hypothetical protein
MAIRKRQQSNNTITFDQVLPTVVGKTQSPNVAGTLPDALVFLLGLNGSKPVQYHHHCETLHRFGHIGIMIHLWSSCVQIEKKEKRNVAVNCSRHITVAQQPLFLAV